MTRKMRIFNAPAMAIFSHNLHKPAYGAAPILGLLVTLAPVAAMAQSGNNLWNPFPEPQVQNTPSQPAAAMPKYYGDAPLTVAPPAPSTQAHSDPQSPSRFAPAGLDRHLSSGPFAQPGYTQIAPSSGPVIGYQAPTQLENNPSTNRPNSPAYYPQGYNNGFNGFGSNTPYNSFGNLGGYGGYAPYPGNNNGNNTGGGFPGFNFSPFGFF